MSGRPRSIHLPRSDIRARGAGAAAPALTWPGRRLRALCAALLTACAAPARVPAASVSGGHELGACTSQSGACGEGARAANRASAPAADGGGDLRALRYEFELNEPRTRLRARLCFEGRVPPALVYGTARSVRFLRAPRSLPEAARGLPLTAALDSPPARALSFDQTHIELPGLPADSCIAYDVDLQAALDQDALMLAYPGEGSLLVSAELFLWRPVKRSTQLRTTARFTLAPKQRVNAPWPLQGGSYQLDETAFAFTGHVIFGQFEERRVPVPGSHLNVVIMNGWPEPARSLIPDWLAGAGAVVSLSTGSFPAPEAQVIVVPTSPNPFPIHFGHTGRSGGGSIVLLFPTDMDREQLRADWIAIHEFSHLLHPFVQRPDAWLSEGLATYLQEVLRVRAGLLPAASAWQRLYEGARLGRATDQSLEHETRIMPHAGNYQRVYWAGAAIALMADVECRRRSAGRVSLDSVLGGLTRRSFLRAQSARELLQVMDELAGTPAFTSTAEPFLTGREFPDLGELYAQLGLALEAGELKTRADAPLAWVRDAIMSEKAPLALPFGRSAANHWAPTFSAR
jgi:hypothetical protein